MNCPRDGAALARVKLLGLDLDKCHQCDGIWLDRGELERLRDAKVSGVEEALEKKYGNPQVQDGAVSAHMRCPRCKDARLLRYTYTYLNPVSIDRCERCHGVWVDDGELDAILGEKQKLDEMKDPGPLRAFARALGRLVGRKEA
ncbi:MAG TPA: zf-TFIIB domain-containing protein [Planctomycetota bacterium]|nr:zf-TFIIB domain-containing protein [Planctomycetota bacterium]HRR82324.1 zf-TFIIB domain-containing protein [Planctomycetota bacterium]HRT95450.1 zf-TFIIB domain-containing protein [Planctomycetota bacterium]